ncbi:MAG: cadherin repeat domain-containing protein [Thiofilum sp.]|nr:cadherin repeat domain-containing protein [Thiofilum sp.]
MTPSTGTSAGSVAVVGTYSSLAFTMTGRGVEGPGGDTFKMVVCATPSNIAPVITSNGGGSSASLSVAENQTAVTTVTATDANGDTLSYSITGGNDASKFNINASTGVLTFISAPNCEVPTDVGANNVYNVQVTVSDGNGGTDVQSIAVTVTDVNENVAPVITSNGGGSSASLSVAENQTAVTTVTATDANGDTLSYSITGGNDASKFNINASTGVLTFISAPNYEVPTDVGANNVYNVQVTVSDGNGGTDVQSIAVTVTDVNENVAPVITSNGGGSSASLSVAENQTAVTTVTATDANGDTLSYSITGGNDASKFNINASTGVLTFISAPNYEVPTDVGANNVYNVQVTVSDGNGGTDVQSIAVTVTDVNENVAPVITSNGGGSSASLSVAENQTAVTTVTATDANGDTLSYSITGGNDASKFNINASTGVLTFISAPNYEVPTDVGANNVYNVQVTVSDGNGGTDVQSIAVTVTDVNENVAPVITSNGGGSSASLSVAENQTAVTTVTATDANGDTLSYSITGGNDASKFNINASTGVLTFISAPNYEVPTDVGANNVYDVQVTVSDGNGGTDVQSIAVTVTDFSEKVLEYTIRRTPDGRYHVYMRPTVAMTQGPNISFTGQITLTVPTGTGVNQFLVNDLQSLVPSVTWSVSSRTDAPTESTSVDYLSFTFAPLATDQFNWQAGTELEVFNFMNPNACIGVVDVMDESDAFNQLPNSVNSVPSNQFTNSGWGTASDNNYLGNYGTPVDCFNNAAPVITSDGGGATAALSVPENQTAVTTVTATDANATDTLTYSISGGADVAKFAINATTGVLTFISAPDYEAPTDVGTDNVYEVQVTVSDGNGGTDVQDISVTVTDVGEGVVLRVKGFLQGPFNSENRLMFDSLRTLNLIPSTQPYSMVPFNYAGTEQANVALLSTTGAEALVDWVLVELRDATTPTIVLATQAALLQRDGDVVTADTGSVDLTFASLTAGNYYVTLRHRNHLGVMSASALPLSPVPTLVDFTLTATAVSGSHARLVVDTTALLWAGDTNKSNHIIANGPSNDINDLLGPVLLHEGNTLLNSNYLLAGYRPSDVDMNGYTLFAGPNNDTNLVIGNVLLHPASTTFSANFVINGGIPQAQ